MGEKGGVGGRGSNVKGMSLLNLITLCGDKSLASAATGSGRTKPADATGLSALPKLLHGGGSGGRMVRGRD